MSVLNLDKQQQKIDWPWRVETSDINSGETAVKKALMDLEKPVYIAENGAQLGMSHVIADS